MLSTLQRDPKNLDLKTDLMVEFTVGGMLAVLQRWPELSDTIEIKDLLKEDVAVLAMGIYLAMSQDMLNYWNRIFVHNAQKFDRPRHAGRRHACRAIHHLIVERPGISRVHHA